MLGEYTALALGLLVAADILDTVMQPAHSFEIAQVFKMGFVAALRTALAYFLGKEIKELEESEHENAHHAAGAREKHDGHHQQQHEGQLSPISHPTSHDDDAASTTSAVSSASKLPRSTFGTKYGSSPTSKAKKNK
jgi:hypothetical protein